MSRKLGTMGTVLGVVIATAFGWIATSPEPALSFFLLDNLDAAGATAPNFAFWYGGRLSSSYEGSLFRVRRTSDSTEQDIGYLEETDRYDAAALAAFCAGADCFVTRAYDQSGNGRNAVNTTTTQQPQIWDDVNGLITCSTKTGTEPCALGDGVDDRLSISAHGFTGAPALTVAVTLDEDRTVFDSDVAAWAVGTTSYPSFRIGNDIYQMGFVHTNTPNTSSSWERQNGVQTLSSHVFALPASGQRTSLVTYTDGAENTIDGTPTGTTATMNMNPAQAAAWGGQTAGSNPSYVLGRLSFFAAWGEQFAGARKTALDAWLVDHTTQIDAAMVVSGQSNAVQSVDTLEMAHSTLPSNFSGLAKVAQSATCIEEWAQGLPLYVGLRDHIAAQPSGRVIIFWWVQGECDAANQTPDYKETFQALITNLETDTGRELRIIDTVLWSDAPVSVAISNEKLEACAEWGPTKCTWLNPRDYPPAGVYDGIHWDEDLIDAVAADAIPYAVSLAAGTFCADFPAHEACP